MNFLVTGGAGFIGSHTADLLLNHGHEVQIVDNLSGGNLKNIEHLRSHKKFSFINKCINDLLPSDLNPPDYVIHFAGIGDIVPSIEYPLDYIKTNVLGTVNILELARKFKVKKFVYAASSSCYGLAKIPTDESNPINPMYPYALSKYQGEQAVFHWAKVYGLNVNSLRIFNAYGTRSRTSGAYGAVIGVFLKQKIEKKPFTVVGDGEQKRDFIYVTDVADAFYRAAITDINNEIFNVGAGNPQSINMLIDLLGPNSIEYIPKRSGEPEVTFAKIDKIRELLNWKPKVDFKTGINLILENIDYWKEAPLWDKDSIHEATKLWFEFMK